MRLVLAVLGFVVYHFLRIATYHPGLSDESLLQADRVFQRMYELDMKPSTAMVGFFDRSARGRGAANGHTGRHLRRRDFLDCFYITRRMFSSAPSPPFGVTTNRLLTSSCVLHGALQCCPPLCPPALGATELSVLERQLPPAAARHSVGGVSLP